MVDVVTTPDLFPLQEDGRMFPVTLSAYRTDYDGPQHTYQSGVDYPPATIRFYNPGGVAKRSDNAQSFFGALQSADLPGSDGKPLPTPAFQSPADGVAYYGYWVADRVGEKPTISKIVAQYNTGNSAAYQRYVQSATGFNADDELSDADLAKVARAMFEWESGGTSSDSMNAKALDAMLSDVDIEDEIERGRKVHEAVQSGDTIGAAILGSSANVSANDEVSSRLSTIPQDLSVFGQTLISPLGDYVIHRKSPEQTLGASTMSEFLRLRY